MRLAAETSPAVVLPPPPAVSLTPYNHIQAQKAHGRTYIAIQVDAKTDLPVFLHWWQRVSIWHTQ